jgi:hypothetical protein
MDMNGQLHPQGKSHRYPLDRRLGGPQSRSGRGDDEKNTHPLPGLEPLIIQPVGQHYTTELSRIHFSIDTLQKSVMMTTFIRFEGRSYRVVISYINNDINVATLDITCSVLEMTSYSDTLNTFKTVLTVIRRLISEMFH